MDKSNIILVAFAGKQGSGKTTVADFLVKNYNFKKISFSDKIKEIAMDLFGLSYEQAYGDSKNRAILQKIGYHMREIDENVWISYLARKIKNSAENFVIDDVRMKTEYNALKALGFKIIRIEADKEIRKKRIPYYINEDDVTELDLDDIKEWHKVLFNEKDKNFLYLELQKLFL